MSWSDLKKAQEESTKRSIVNGNYLELREPGDGCRVTLIGPPEVVQRTSKAGRPYTMAEFRVLTPEAERELTLKVFPWQAGNIGELCEASPPDSCDYMVEAVSVGTKSDGTHKLELRWTPVERTLDSQVAADDHGLQF